MVWTAGQSPYVNILYSACIVLPLAYLSWHFVEKPAINIRGKLGSVLTGGRLGERLTVVFKGKLRPASVRADSTVV
jgi:peptidoglycan/LPS O-acetylase OafA/YrhL